MKKFLFVVAAMLMASVAFAQTGSVKFVLSDPTTGEGVAFATVSATPEGATKASKYILTDENGAGTIEKLKNGTYTIKAELLGYKPYSTVVKVAGKLVDLGKVNLETDTQVLDAASVSAVGNPVIVKKDTIEYNATMFRTTDNDMLIDLLKKLPGIEVSSDGSVTANGKTIDKITIDGKTFFLDDPQLATQNLPAKMIEKVKVVEKKSDQAIFTGIDDGEEENIIDLTVKQGMMNGWFGNITAAGGYDMTEEALTSKNKTMKNGEAGDAGIDHARFSINSMTGKFNEKGQIAIILNANNTNRRGFGMMGGMPGGGGDMEGGMGMMGGGNSRGGALGLSGSGITTSWMGGINGAYNFLDDAMEFAGNYVYNGSNNFLDSDNYKEVYQTDETALFYKSKGTKTTLSQGHRIGFRIDYKITENTSILFEPQFIYNYGSKNSYSDDLTNQGVKGDLFDATKYLNQGFTSSNTNNNDWTASGRFLLRQRLGKPGRTMTLNVRYSFRQGNENGFNQSLSQTYNDLNQSWNATPATNQYVMNTSKSSTVRSQLTYTEPLAEGLYLETSYQYNWSRSVTNKNAFDLDYDNTLVYDRDLGINSALVSGLAASATDFLANMDNYLDDKTWYDSHYNSIYSNSVINNSQTHRAGLLLQYQKSGLRAQVGAAYQPTITDNTTTGNEPYHNVAHNWSPRARIEYEFNDNTDFYINYNGRSSQPSTSQLLPVPDNSNPLAVSFGNPYLNPSFSHNFNGMFGWTNKQTFTSVHAFANASLTQNGIYSATWTDNGGVSYSLPLNGKLTGSASIGSFMYTPIAKSNFSINNMTNISYNASRSYVGRAEMTQQILNTYYNADDASFDYNQFHKDFFSNSSTKNLLDYFIDNKTQTLNVMERLSLTYRSDYIETSIGAGTNVNKPWYSKELDVTKKATWNNSATASFQWTTKSGFTAKTDMNYKWYNGYTIAREDEWIWNAQISHTIIRNQATIALQAYDLLGQTRSLSVSDDSNYHQESVSNALRRYVMVSFTWRFGTFGGRNGRGMGRGRGPMGGGRGPMGPPMGGGPMGGGPRF